MKTILATTALFCLIYFGSTLGQTSKETVPSGKNKIVKTTGVSSQQQLILWTSGDREVALKMVFMYALNCKKHGWMDNVRLLIWGPAQKLLTEDEELQKYLGQLKNAGVELYACKGCADMYGIAEKLSGLGVTVKYTGKMLADLQKQGWFILSI